MKKECVYTRKSLGKYLHGHLFKLQKMRIDRHLRSCVVCRSEFDALRRKEETRLLLKDFAQDGGVLQRVTEGFSGLTRLRKVFYRPLWIALIVVFAAAVYSYMITPRQIDLEIESIVKTAPTGTVHSAAIASAPAATAPATKVLPAASSAPAVDPLTVAIAIAPEEENAAIRRINEIMRGHAQLRKNKFSDEVREISGTLTARELQTFFNRIEETGRISYSRKRFESFPGAQQIPFVLKLKLKPADRSEKKQAPPVSTASTPTEIAVPAPPAVAPPAQAPGQ